MKNLDKSELLSINGGKWKKLFNIGPGEYQRNDRTGKYRWVQTEDNFSYTTKVIANGWVSSAAGGYIHR